jgi:hypothetical protein
MGTSLKFERLKMPDQDRFERGFAPGWGKVYRLAKGGITTEAELSDACITALAYSLRQSAGCPGLQDIVNVLQGFVGSQGVPPLLSVTSGPTLTEAFEALRRIERQQGGHRTTKVAVRAAMSIVVQLSRQSNSHDSKATLGQMLSEQTCLGLVDHHFFGRARAYLVGERFSSFHEARAWEQTVKKAMSTGMSKLAARLWENPAAAHLRAPKRAVPRRSTRDILNDFLIG